MNYYITLQKSLIKWLLYKNQKACAEGRLQLRIFKTTILSYLDWNLNFTHSVVIQMRLRLQEQSSMLDSWMWDMAHLLKSCETLLSFCLPLSFSLRLLGTKGVDRHSACRTVSTASWTTWEGVWLSGSHVYPRLSCSLTYHGLAYSQRAPLKE